MLHSDVRPAPWWLDRLFEELVRLRADVVSTVSAMKDDRGLTTTAIGLAEEPYGFVRRLTMHEIMRLPETFCFRDLLDAGLAEEGQCLLVNTGCWLCDLRKPWVTALDAAGNYRVYFTTTDRIRPNAAGDVEDPIVDVASEDWNFSRMLAREGASVWATRRVNAKHAGETDWPNDRAWGRWERDEDALKLAAKGRKDESAKPDND
jgi:hypothetical protein